MKTIVGLGLLASFMLTTQSLGVVTMGISDTDGLLDANSTVAAPGQSFTVRINIAMTGGENVAGVTFLPLVDKSNVLSITGRSILSGTISDPTADVLASPTLNPQSTVDVGATSLNVNTGISVGENLMTLTLKIDAATPANAYPIKLSFGKARWATPGANSVSAAADTAAAVYTVYLPGSTPPVLATAVSRKNHAGAGDWDISLPTAGVAGVECRSGGPTQVILTYDKNIGGIPTASFSSGSGSVSITGPKVLTVSMSGATDGSCVTITISNLADAVNPAMIASPHGVKVLALWGDANGNGFVNSNDIALVKSKSGLAVDASSFRMDLNANGAVNSNDIAVVKSRSGLLSPGPCNY